MSTIEERVVSMKFDGNQFLAGIDKSLGKLTQLETKVKGMGAAGLDKVEASAQRLGNGGMNAIANGVQHVSDRFKTMGIVGMTAISNITNQALFAGKNLVKSLTVDPILQGFREYETNLNSIQTILANTQSAGTNLSDVTAALDELNHYSDQTIYNFSEMARNIGTFTAAGVALKPATAAIKGIANLAALSGSNSEQASAAMYQLSQAISSGRVTLQDWNSVVNAGMGGTVFQRALAQTAVKMGTLDKGAVTLKGSMKNVSIEGKSFRESIEAGPGKESWLTSKVLTQTLAQFTGDLSDAELAVMGFNKTEIAAIQKQAATAKAAATEVKSMSQLLGTLKESAGSGWAQTWKTIFGDFEGAKKLFTNVNNVLGGFISKSADARNKVLGDWAKLGGRTALIEGIGNAFKALVSVIKPIRDAFREVFPPATGQQLARISFIIRNFTANLAVSGSTADKIKRIFKGFFSVIGIGWDILKGFIGLIGRLTGVAFEGGGGFLDFAAKVGDFFVNLRQAIKDGKGIENFFRGLGAILEIPIRAIKLFGQALAKAFEKIGGDKVISTVEKVSGAMDPMADQAEKVATGWEKVKNTLIAVWKKIEAIGSWIVEKFAGLGDMVSNLFAGMNFEDVTRGLNTGIFASLAVMFKMFIGGGNGGGFLDNLNDSLESLTNTLKFMQGALVAATLLQIAVAIGILALSLNILAKIDAEGLTRGSAAMAGLVAQLMATMLVVEKFTTWKGAAKLPFIAGSLILLGAAVYILAAALQKLSGLEWEGIAKGLTGVGVLLAMLVGVANTLPKGPSFVLGAVSILIMSAAIRVLAGAVQSLSGMSWEEMAKGLVGVGVLMAALVAFANTAKLNAKGMISGVVIFLLAKAIQMLASALEDVSRLSWEQMARGLAVTAAGLGLLAGSLRSLPPSSIISAAAIIIAAQAVQMIGDAISATSHLSWEEIGRGMTVIGGTLIILAGALKVMQGSMGGAAALTLAALSLNSLSVSLEKNAKLSWEEIGKGMTVIAGSIIILATAMKFLETAEGGELALLAVAATLAVIGAVMIPLSKLTWEQIAAGMVALAGTFIVLGLAALILQPILPALYTLAIAVALIGVAMLAAGAGIALFGAGIFLLALGFSALAVSGVAGATALIGMISVLIGGLPTILDFLGKLLIGLIQLVIDAVPKLQEMGVAIMTGFLNGVRKVVPLIIEVILFLLLTLVTKLRQYVPLIADQGLKMITGILRAWANNIGAVVDAAGDLIAAFLRGLARNIPKIAKEATNVIVTFIREIGKNGPKIADAGMKMIIDFINGLADSVRDNAEDMRSAGKNLALAIIDGMTGGLGSGVGRVVDKAKEVARGALDAAKNVLGINSPSKEFEKIGNYVNDGFRKGLDGNKGQIDRSFNDLKSKLLTLSKSAKATASERKKAATAYSTLTQSMADEHTLLGQLATRYDTVTARLKKANEEYAKAVKSRKEFDDYEKSTRDKYSDVATPGNDQSATDFVEKLKKQVEDTKTFTNQMHQLAKMGLNQETYKDLVDQGLDALPFVSDLLKGGQGQIDQINALNKEIDNLGDSLGQGAADDLYKIGVNSAAGLVAGLKKEQAAIEAQMDKIASTMVGSIKKALGIRSPSRVFAKVGEYSAQGLQKGFEKNSGAIADSASSAGNQAVEAMRVSLSNIDKMVAGNIDLQPRIRPVLDLTDVRKNAGKLGTMVPSGQKMQVKTSYANASSLAEAINERRSDDDFDPATGGVQLNYTQNNYSPKAISPVEVYRGTKNQLSTVKGALST